MRIRGEIDVSYDFRGTGLDLSTSSHLADPDKAIRLVNFDLSRERGALAGRRGSVVIHQTQGELGGAVHDIYITENPDALPSAKKYMIISYTSGGNWRLSAADITAGDDDYTFNTLLLKADGTDVNFATGKRFSFCTTYDNALDPNQVVVLITNNHDQTYYWDFSEWSGLVAFDVGTVSPVRVEGFLSVPWDGRVWAWKQNTIYWAAADDPHSWVEEDTTAGFREAPLEQYQNPIRALQIIGNNLTVINSNTIGHMFKTGSTSNPYRYRQDHAGSGTFNHRSIIPWGDKIIFFDKRPPYLFMWNGTTLGKLDPEENMVNGIQKYLDLSEAPSIRLAVAGDNLRISMAVTDNIRPDAISVQTVAKINLTKKDLRLGIPYYPWTLDSYQANDIVASDRGSYMGQFYFADSRANEHWIYREYDFYDLAPYGDYNNALIPAMDTRVEYQWRSPFMNCAPPGKVYLGKMVKKFMTFFLRARWEGTPAAGDTLEIAYRFEYWSGWNTLVPKEILQFDEIPFPAEANGREIQVQLTYKTKSSIPIIDEYGFKYVPVPGIRD